MSRMRKAVWYEENGPAAQVLVHGEMPVPAAAAGEVLVRLHTSGVNPSDVKARAGSRPMAFDRVVPHSDGAGIIEAVGEGGDPAMGGCRVPSLCSCRWDRPAMAGRGAPCACSSVRSSGVGDGWGGTELEPRAAARRGSDFAR